MQLQYTTWLRWGIIGGLFAVPFVSFIVADGSVTTALFFPYITGKNFLFRIVVEVLLGLYVLLALRDPRYRPRASLIAWTVLAFVAWMGVATVFSVDPIKSFWSNFERMEGYIALLHLLAYFAVAGAVLTADKLWERFFKTSVGVSVLHGFVAIYQAMSATGDIRTDSTLGNPTYLAVFVLVNFFLTLYLLAKSYERGRLSAGVQMLYGVALVVQGIAIVFTQTRGAMLGLAAGLVVAALYILAHSLWTTRGAQGRALRLWSLGALVALALLGGAVYVFRDSATIQQIPGFSRIASISLNDATTLSRFLIWNMAYQGFLEKPVTGWGQENFNFVFNKYYSPQLYGQEEWFDRAHNQFIDWLVAGGAPAFVLYTALYVLFIWAVFRSTLSVPEQAALIGLFAAFGFNNMFVFDNLMSALCFFALLAYAHGLSRKELPGWIFLSRPLGDHAIAIAVPLVAVAVVVGVWQLNIVGWNRAAAIIQGVRQNEDLSVNLEALERAQAPRGLGGQEAAEQLIRVGSAVIAAAGQEPELKERYFEATQKASEDVLAVRQNDTRLELLYGDFLAASGQHEAALQHLEISYENAPSKQLILFHTGNVHLTRGSIQAALPFFEKAFELEPRYDSARMQYAAALYYAGRNAEADALLEERFGTVLVFDDALNRAYAATKNFSRMIAVAERQAEENPDSAQVHANLANAYFTASRINEAIAELERAAQLDTSLAPRVRELVEQIRSGALRP